MSDDHEDTWAKTSATAATNIASQKTLREMLTSARDKSKGQGVVQGSTIFFKNLAESVKQSNRNLKIGLAFLAISFVVIASSLGFMVFKAFEKQRKTEETLSTQIARAGGDVQKQLELMAKQVEEMKTTNDRLVQQIHDLEATRSTLQQEVSQARSEAMTAKQDLAAIKQGYTEVRAWILGFNDTYTKDRNVLSQRIDSLSRGQK